MTRLVLSTALILEAARRGRLTYGPLGVQLDGRDVDERGGHEVVGLLDAGYLTEDEDGTRIVPAAPGNEPTIDGFLERWTACR